MLSTVMAEHDTFDAAVDVGATVDPVPTVVAVVDDTNPVLLEKVLLLLLLLPAPVVVVPVPPVVLSSQLNCPFWQVLDGQLSSE